MNWFGSHWITRTLIIGGLITLLLTAGVTWWLQAGGHIRTVYRDRSNGIDRASGQTRVDSHTARIRKILWSGARRLPQSQVQDDADGGRLQDRDVLLLSLPSPQGDADIWVRRRTTNGWSAPRRIAGAINSPSREIDPVLSRDGQRIYFASDRPGGKGGIDLWVSQRGEGGWAEPRSLGPRVNSPWDERSPAIHPSERLLVFSSNRPEGFLRNPPEDWDQVPVERWQAESFQLASVSSRTKGNWRRWEDLSLLETIVSPLDDVNPSFTPAGDALFFASNRQGGFGGMDLYRSRLTVPASLGDPNTPVLVTYHEAINLGEPINTPGGELAPRLYDRGFALVLRRTPAGDERAWQRNPVGSEWATSTSIEVEEELEVAEIPLAAIASHAAHIVVLVLSTFAFTFLFILLYRQRESWTVNLLARCAVVALLAHLGLGYTFYTWKLTAEILAAANKEKEAEISLESSIAARINVEVQQQDLSIPEPEAESMDAAPVPESQRDVDLTPDDPSTRTWQAQASKVQPIEVALAVTRTNEDRGKVAQQQAQSDLRPDAAPVESVLPQNEQRAVENAPEPSPDTSATKSFKVEEYVASNPTVDRATIAATDTPSEAQSTTITKLAETSVVGPEPSPLLPRISRASPPTAELASLPQPEQSPQEGTPEEEIQPAAASKQNPGSVVASNTPAPQSVSTTRIDAPAKSIDRTRSDLSPKLDPIDGAKVLSNTPVPSPTRSPATSSKTKLPENVPIADTTGARSEPSPEPSPSASERTDPRVTIRPAMVNSDIASAELAPTSTQTSKRPLKDSALANPAERSSPGGLRIVKAGLDAPVRDKSKPALPEDRGSREAADVVAADLSPTSTGRTVTTSQADAPGGAPKPTTLASTPTVSTPRKTDPSTPTPSVVKTNPLDRDGPKSSARRNFPTPRVATAKLRPPTSSEKKSAAKLPEMPAEIAKADLRHIRTPASRERLLSRLGGTKESEEAVLLSLDWFARHQSPDGRWDSDGFDKDCGKCKSTGYMAEVDAAITGMVILCYLGHNHVPGSTSRYSRHVERALDWLIGQQTKSGVLAGEDKRYTMYSHGIATLALSEAFLMSQQEKYRAPLRRATDVILRAQNMKTGGWRYRAEPPPHGDSSISGWQVLALTSVKTAGLKVPEKSLELARHWFDVEVASGVHGGKYGYRKDEDPRVSMTAEGMYARQLLGARRGDRAIEEAARYIHSETSTGDQISNLYLLYYGTLALHQYQGWIWESWNERVQGFLLSKQRQDGKMRGSWDPMDEYAEAGGRVLATAFACLTLEVYYRYLPLYWGD